MVFLKSLVLLLRGRQQFGMGYELRRVRSELDLLALKSWSFP